MKRIATPAVTIVAVLTLASCGNNPGSPTSPSALTGATTALTDYNHTGRGTVALTESDVNVVLVAADISSAQIAFGMLAQARGDSVLVKRFGAQLIQDHTVALEQLRGIAQGTVPVDMILDSSDQELYNTLATQNGSEFDRLFVSLMTTEIQTTAASFSTMLAGSTEVRARGSNLLSKLNSHLALLRDIDTRV